LKPALDAPQLLLLPTLELASKERTGFRARGADIDFFFRVGFVVVEQRRVGAAMMN
jgi:hypothetical protein